MFKNCFETQRKTLLTQNLYNHEAFTRQEDLYQLQATFQARNFLGG